MVQATVETIFDTQNLHNIYTQMQHRKKQQLKKYAKLNYIEQWDKKVQSPENCLLWFSKEMSTLEWEDKEVTVDEIW